MKKIISMLLVFVLVLSACAGNNNTEVSIDAERVTEAELDVWAPSGRNSEWMEHVVGMYNDEFNTNITLNFVDTAPNDYVGKVSPTLAAGEELPEISFIQDKDINQIYSEYPTAYVSLEDYGLADKLEEDVVASKIDIMRNATGGDLYGFGYDSAPALVFYRKDLFEQSNIDYENDIKTMQDLLDAGEKIYEDSGVKMLGMSSPTDPSYYNIYMQMQGVGFTDKDGNYQFTSDEGVKAAELLYTSQNSDATSTFVNSDQGQATRQESSIVVAGSWWAGLNERNTPDNAGKWSVSALPQFDEDTSQDFTAVDGGSGWYVASNSSDAQAALQVLEWVWTNEEPISTLIDYTLTPASMLALESDKAQKDNEYYEMNVLELVQEQSSKNSEHIYFNFPYVTTEATLKVELGNYVDGDGENPSVEDATQKSEDNIKAQTE